MTSMYLMAYCSSIHYVLVFVFLHSLFSLDRADYPWTGIGDEGATALTDPRVMQKFKMLK